MAYKEADAKRKKKQELLEQRFHSTPSTKVSTVVLKNDTPRATASRGEKTTNTVGVKDPTILSTKTNAVYTVTGEKPTLQKLPYTGGRATASNGVTLPSPARRTTADYERVRSNADYKTGAAYGWKAYREDREREKQLRRSPGYQRWSAYTGSGSVEEASATPQKNWTFDQNNTFGYLYNNRDKTEARSYATLVNEENRKKLQETGHGIWESIRESQNQLANSQWQQSQTQADWVKRQIQQVAKTEQDYAQAQAKAVNDMGQKGGDSVLGYVRDASTTLNNAQYQQAQAQAEEAKALKQRAQKNYTDAAWAYSDAQQRSAQQIGDAAQFTKDAYSEYYSGSNKQRGEQMAVTSGITGSDQTGGSIYGYRNDTSWKEPQDSWTPEERAQYDRLKTSSPSLADSYAANVNDKYNQAERNQRVQQITAEVNGGNGQAMLHGLGARAGSQLKGLDGYNSMLEYAARGKITTNPDLSPGAYAQTVDNAISDRISREHGKTLAGAYSQGTQWFDDIVSYATLGPTKNAIKSGIEAGTERINDARNQGSSDRDALAQGFWEGFKATSIDLGVGAGVEKIPESLGKSKIMQTIAPLVEKGSEAYNKAYSKLPKTTQKLLEGVPSEAISAGVVEGIMDLSGELLGKGFSTEQIEKILNYEVKKIGKATAGGAMQKIVYNALRK